MGEMPPYKQYKVKLDGSGRITLRNRRHLRKFTPFYTKVKRPVEQSVAEPDPAPVADNPPTPAGNQDPNVTIRKEILDQDVPDLEVISPDSPGADQSQIENALSQPSNTPKENKASSQT